MNCNCDNIKDAIDTSPKGETESYTDVAKRLADAASSGSMELLAGDCELNDVWDVVDSDEHFSVSHLFRCIQCDETYFIGVCIRGAPIYKHGVPVPEPEALKNLYWGRLGLLFKR